MLVDRKRACPLEDPLRGGHVVHGAVRDDDELVGLERGLIPEDAVLGDADAVEACADRRQTPWGCVPYTATTVFIFCMFAAQRMF